MNKHRINKNKKLFDNEIELLDEEIVLEQKLNEMLDHINISIAQQICNEMDVQEEKCERNATFINSDLYRYQSEQKGVKYKANQKKPFLRWVKITGITSSVILCISILLILTPGGRNFIWNTVISHVYSKMVFDEGEDVVYQEVKDDVVNDDSLLDTKLIVDSKIEWNKDYVDEGAKAEEGVRSEEGARVEEGVTNILLLGEEAIDSGSGRGRTDLMMIATINTKDKTLKLTSLMRDVLVQIPGHQDNKLNAAYEIGGVPLLYKSIELNFDIKMQGYALVGFDDFEDIINKLGGVRISLTEEEASYLNNNNYISKPEYRTVVKGSQVMNGNQALGYCRIRYVETEDNQLNDYGRTSRQRVLLNAIFEKYKSKSLPEVVLLCNEVLPLITTDMKEEDFESYIKAAVTMGLSDMENLRIPVDYSFDEGYVRKMAVLIPDLSANIEVLHHFIFGDTE